MVGVTTMLTVAVPFTANVPIAQVTAAGVPVAPVHDPGEAVALVNVVPVPGSTSRKFTLNAGSGPVLVIVYLKVRVFPTPTVGGEGRYQCQSAQGTDLGDESVARSLRPAWNASGWKISEEFVLKRRSDY